MAYAEKRTGSLTGQWIGQVRNKQGGCFRHAFETRKEAEAYEAYVRMMGVEPPTILDGAKLATAGRSFRDVAEKCKAAGGPRGAWLKKRDKSVLQRLEFAIERLGAYDIADVTRALVREKIIEDLKRRPRPGSDRTKLLKQGTINRYTSAVSAVLTWAEDERIIGTKPRLQFPKEMDRQEREVIAPQVEDGAVAWLTANGFATYATCVRWLAETGMRLGELYKLAPEQIANDHIKLEKEQTKTGRPRLVYVRPELAREMRAIIAGKLLPDSIHLLKMFQKAAKAAGCESHVVLHGLRHTLNTRMRKAGVAEKLRMEILGHSSAEVNRGYDHVDLGDQRAAVEAAQQIRGLERAEVVEFPAHTTTQPIEKTG